MKDRIRKIRRELDLTQQQFADRLGIKRGAIANYEIGRNEPVDSIISLICREFKVNEEWLRNGTGKMFIDPASFSLDEYAAANSLTNRELSIVRGFMELEPETRQAIYNIFSNAFSEKNAAIPDDPQELERLYPPIDSRNSDVG